MPLNSAGKNAAASGVTAVAGYLSLHTGDPGTTGTNAATSARQAIAWGSPSNGVVSITTAENFTGGAASGPCTHFGIWSAVSGGTFYGGGPLTGDQTFNASGEYTVDSITLSIT